MDRLSDFKLATGDVLKGIGPARRWAASSCNAFAIATFSSFSNFRCRKGVPLFNAIVPWIQYCKFGVQQLETSLYRVVQSIFRYLEPLRRVSKVWQTDRQTDRLWHNKCHTSLGCTAKKCGPLIGGARALWWLCPCLTQWPRYANMT